MKHGPAMHMGSSAKQLAAYEVKLKGKEQIAEDTCAFVFEKPKGFHFSAGQHVRMTLIDPSETDVKGNRRFFTMASTPGEPNLVFAMRMSDTAFKRVLSRMKVGEAVLIEKLLESPRGAFVLHEDAARPAVFIVGGIGIVPAYSMIKDAIRRKLRHKMFLFYSSRRPEDAPYLNELQSLAEQNPSFKLIATVTEPEKSVKAWQGETGSINRAMLEKHVDGLRSPIYYVAGLPEMVSAMQAVLSEAGVDKDNIRAEEFAGFRMGRNEHAPDSRMKNHLLIVASALVALAMIIAHVGGASHISLTALSFNNPLSYLVLGLLFGVVAFKVFALFRLKDLMRSRQGWKQLSARDILKAHKLTRKK